MKETRRAEHGSLWAALYFFSCSLSQWPRPSATFFLHYTQPRCKFLAQLVTCDALTWHMESMMLAVTVVRVCRWWKPVARTGHIEAMGKRVIAVELSSTQTASLAVSTGCCAPVEAVWNTTQASKCSSHNNSLFCPAQRGPPPTRTRAIWSPCSHQQMPKYWKKCLPRAPAIC